MAARTIGRYQVVRLLGTGGFSSVYLARDDRLDTDVAIKVLAENWAADADISRRFVEEARLLRRCDDDRVVRVHTIEQLDDGRPYFVMDYADAGTLADRMVAALDAGRRAEVGEAVDLACELADCLTVVHDNRIVHRDLKPSNVLFRTVRSGERMVLGDFGLARQLVSATGRTVLAGTPEYIAPEQADPALAATVDERADVYAAAVILHEQLTGAVPFTHASFESAAAARQQAPDLRAVRPDVPPELAAVVARGMALDRDERFPSSRAWLAALTALRDGLAGATDVAAPVPPSSTAPAPPAPPAPAFPPAAASTNAEVAAPPTTAAGAPGSGRRRPVWPLVAGVLGALAVIAALAVLLGRSASTSSGGTPSTVVTPPAAAAAPPSSAGPTTAAPPATATAPTAAPLSGPAGWFAAASAST
ncbi:MAG TPA: serine/threonine-protein kinase, partial [Acidimicrobiales bacterium]|nr:serine/threonine-protein kinase [Acidimicrobiales bacterium]